jgi:hypothetical protein
MEAKQQITNNTPIIGDLADIIVGMSKPTVFNVNSVYKCNGKRYKLVKKTKKFVTVQYEDIMGLEVLRRKILFDKDGNEYINVFKTINNGWCHLESTE